MGQRLKQALATVALALGLFLCVWVTRVFLAGEIVGPLMHLTVRAAIVGIALIGGALPSLPLGLAYGLMRSRNTAAGALVVAVLACAPELGISTASVPWWKFRTWWVLPLESLTVLVVFVLAAILGARLRKPLEPRFRVGLGVGLFVLLTVCAVTGPWLFRCIRSEVCSVFA